jgi:hypothetical protein
MKKVKVDSRFDGVNIDTEKPVKMVAKNAISFRSNVMGNMGGHVEFNTLINPEYNQVFGCFTGKLIGGEEVSVFTGNLLTASMVNLYAASAYKQENPYSRKKELNKLVVFSLPTNYEFDGFSDSNGVIPLCVGSLDKE